MNSSIAIQVLPNVNGTDEVIRVVDKVIEYIKSTGLNYEVGPFETVIEGDFDELMEIAKKCQEIASQDGSNSVATYIKMFYHPNGDLLTIEEKISKHK